MSNEPTGGSASFGHNGGPPLADLISLSINDAAARTGIPKTTLYDLMNAGRLETFVLGRRRFIDAASLRKLIAAQKEAAPSLNRRRYFGANAPPGENGGSEIAAGTISGDLEEQVKHLSGEKKSRCADGKISVGREAEEFASPVQGAR